MDESAPSASCSSVGSVVSLLGIRNAAVGFASGTGAGATVGLRLDATAGAGAGVGATGDAKTRAGARAGTVFTPGWVTSSAEVSSFFLLAQETKKAVSMGRMMSFFILWKSWCDVAATHRATAMGWQLGKSGIVDHLKKKQAIGFPIAC